MIQDKAQSAVNGYSLNKGCNAGLNHLWGSDRQILPVTPHSLKHAHPETPAHPVLLGKPERDG
ncbi:MAG: hypothetical protein ACN4GR_05285, partial [Arenicellales bacterium]